MASFGSKHGVDDMVMLTSITEAAIVDNLKKRFNADVIYTYIGHVLISVNPYKWIQAIYTDRLLKDYRGKYRYELPPHVYALSDAMYRQMMSEGENQCVIISGESGAGKTEASKKILQYIAAVSGDSPEVNRVKDIILESNPLLEAFGNAKTIRNNNSSRFGKYMEIQFNLSGDPEGGRITNYLLEKSRVVYQTNGERGFHIFYQLLKGGDSRMVNDLGLMGPENFWYISQGNAYIVDNMDDTAEFKDTLKAMSVVGISQQEQDEILRLVTAILYLGNINFNANHQDYAEIADKQTLDWFSSLIQCNPANVQAALLFRTIQTGTEGQSKRMSTYNCPNSVDGAIYSRDALAKALYSRMFDYIIAKVNAGLVIDDPDAFSIGVLDIYGFEIFGKNGFEQLCINYVNEKLQQIFIQLTLKAEQEEYATEGIPWKNIDYFNNQICCDLIESKKNPIGVLSHLDDVCNFPKGTDDKYLQKLNQAFTSHAHYQPNGATEFIIKHYAGDVSYNVDGFCDKNRDLLFNDLIDLATATNSPFIPCLFPEAKEKADKRKPTSAGFKIKTSIGELVATLSICQPHYIRCIKPNEKKQAGRFDDAMVTHQVRYLGLLENVRVRRAGFAYRQFYDKFFYRYRVCSDKTWPSWSGDFVSGADAIMSVMNVGSEEIAKGKTKIFIKSPETVFSLEELRDRKVYTYANTIQRFFLRFALRRYYWDLQMNGNRAVQGKKERRRLSLERPFHGDNCNYRENFPLKDILKSYGREKTLFADVCTEYVKGSKKARRTVIITEAATYIVGIEKNKDKDKLKRKKLPWIYQLIRRMTMDEISGVQVSTHQDNFILFNCGGQPSTLIEDRRKTEIIATLVLKKPGLSVAVNDNFQYAGLKGKPKLIQCATDPKKGSPNGKLAGKKILVSPGGLPKDSMPNIPEPAQAEVRMEAPPTRGIVANPSRGRGRGGARGGASSRPTPAGQQVQLMGSAPAASSNRPTPGGRGGAAPAPAPAAAAPRGGGGGGGGGAPRGRGGPAGGRGAPAPAAAPSGPPKLVGVAQYDFEAENPDELNFREGDHIIILEKVEKDWWKGELNGQEGLFPASYVNVIEQAGGGGGRGGGAQRGRGGGPAPGGRAGRAGFGNIF